MRDGYRYFGKGLSGTKYYIEMSQQEIREREKFHLFLAVITVTPMMGIIMAMAGGLI